MNTMRELSRLIGALVGFVLFGMAGTANAALISNNCGFSGPGDCTLETATSTQWLDLTESTNLSFNFVSTQFGTGGQFEGWGYASEAEVFTLFTNAGFTNVGTNAFTPANFPPYSAFVGLLGETTPTRCAGDCPFTMGISDTFSDGLLRAPYVQIITSLSLGRPISTTRGPGIANGEFGSWLIRVATPVPEPASLLLFLLGLASLFAFASSGLSGSRGWP